MIVLLDTETHSVKNPRAIEVAFGTIESLEGINNMDMFYERCDPGVPIDISASAIHDIVDSDVKGMPTFKDGGLYDIIQGFNTPENYLVAHNAPFDIMVLKNEGIDIKMKVIDTLRCTKKLLMKTSCEEFNMQYLKYYLKLHEEDVPEQLKPFVGRAHGAAADVVTLFLLFRRLAARYSLEELRKITEENIIYDFVPMGKHKGKHIMDVVANNRGYANWVFKNMDDPDVVASFKYWTAALRNKNKEKEEEKNEPKK